MITYIDGICHFRISSPARPKRFTSRSTASARGSDVLGGFLLPALIGNTIGGVTLVAALAHAEIVGDKDHSAERDRRAQ